MPYQRRFVTAVTAGRIEQIYFLPGAEVDKTTVLLRLSNPDVEIQLLRSQEQLSSAVAALLERRTSLRVQLLAQEAKVTTTQTLREEAQREYDANQRLYDMDPKLVALADLDRMRGAAKELTDRVNVERQILEALRESLEARIEAQEQQIERLGSVVRFNQRRLASLEVQAGVSGVLAELTLEEGQWVQSGGSLARIDQPDRLKAQLRIPQSQADLIAAGQNVLIDTRRDTIRGVVVRIDPAVEDGTITLDASLPDELPSSARPDLNIDGKVIVDELENIVYVGRPSYVQANSNTELFVLTRDQRQAERRTVRIGVTSLTEIEIVRGLSPGEIVILSDVSIWDGYYAVRLQQ